MLSSKELMALTGISRATLNNYIQLGILPRPEVRRSEAGDGGPPRLGYFPDDAPQVITRVAQLKHQGMSMAEIAASLAGGGRPAAGAGESYSPRPLAPTLPQLTIETFGQAAYLVNKRFEVEWCSDQAAVGLLGRPGGLPFDIRDRRVFDMLLSSKDLLEAEGREELLRFHLSIAKPKLSKSMVLAEAGAVPPAERELLDRLHDSAEPAQPGAMLSAEVNLAAPGQPERWCSVYASFFREGVLFVYSPASTERMSLLSWLARRDLVIRDILKRRRPYLTPLAAVVAELQDSVKICAELPPEEYFQLVNQVWRAMEPNLRLFQATHGKHAGDGIVYYFFPQPDSHYVMNALRCAQNMRRTMQEISREWRRKKGWLNELRLNIGIDEGEEWFGTYQTATQLEFTVLGETVNKASRLSTFASSGSIWAAKNVLGKLPAGERDKIRFGIRRTASDREEIIVPSTYARISNLVDMAAPRGTEFRDIAMAPVTEIFDIGDD